MALPSSVRTALTVAGLVVAAAGLHAVSPTTSDPDGFYEVRHARVCAPGDREATSLVLRRDFGAAFVLVHRSLNPLLDGYLAANPAFLRVFDDGTDVLYALQYDAAPPPGGAP